MGGQIIGPNHYKENMWNWFKQNDKTKVVKSHVKTWALLIEVHILDSYTKHLNCHAHTLKKCYSNIVKVKHLS